jgi:hypothetical protein
VKGIMVLNYEIHDPHEEVFARIGQAVHLIETVDRHRFARIRRDLKHILVRQGTGAQYWLITGTCALGLADVQRRSVPTIALMIVHEATHARLNNCGVYPWLSLRARLEHRCLKEERSFALLLGDAGYSGVDKLLEWLDRCAADVTAEGNHLFNWPARRPSTD